MSTDEMHQCGWKAKLSLNVARVVPRTGKGDTRSRPHSWHYDIYNIS